MIARSTEPTWSCYLSWWDWWRPIYLGVAQKPGLLTPWCRRAAAGVEIAQTVQPGRRPPEKVSGTHRGGANPTDRRCRRPTRRHEYRADGEEQDDSSHRAHQPTGRSAGTERHVASAATPAVVSVLAWCRSPTHRATCSPVANSGPRSHVGPTEPTFQDHQWV